METTEPEIQDQTCNSEVTQRYLRLLRLPQKEPSLNALTELVSAHLQHVPFENISKLYHWKRLRLAGLPGFPLFLDGIEHHHFGGTCYSNNFHFNLLLKCLGYNARLCAADMSAPGEHMVSVVTVEEQEYLVDTGYGAPFLSPLPLDLGRDYVIQMGRDSYVLSPKDAAGCSRLELYRDGKLKHRYVVRPEPKKLRDFQRVIESSFQPTATFLNSILLARFWPGRSLVIHNQTLIDSSTDRSLIRSLHSRNELIGAIERWFEIPREIASEAIAGLGELEDAWTEPTGAVD